MLAELPAPDLRGITLCDHEGGDLALEELEVTRYCIVLLPGAFTPVCTEELPGIDELWQRFGEVEIPVLAVSCDSAPVLAAWRESAGIRMPLLSDYWPHGALARALGAFDERTGRCRRESMIVRSDGRIEHRLPAPQGGGARDLDRLAQVLSAR